MSKILLAAFLITLACKPKSNLYEPREASSAKEESLEIYEPKIISSSKLAPVDFDTGNHSFIDIRGVGDSGWVSVGTENPPAKSGFLRALKQFDPGKELLVGHVNFINWETTVTNTCKEFYNVDFPFIGSQLSVNEAISWGFNLFGVSNNHSEDCKEDGEGRNGALSTKEIFSNLGKSNNISFSGLGEGNELEQVSVQSFKIRGRSVRVAFAALSVLSWWTEHSTRYAYHGSKILEDFKRVEADLRILSIHTEGLEVSAVGYAKKFIEQYDGDIVFQHGPHTWRGVKIYDKNDGGKGVAFHGLGNFIHNYLGHNSKNLIGRVLLDFENVQLKQVQVIPVENWVDGKYLSLNRNFDLPPANFEWKKHKLESNKLIPVGVFNP